VCEFERARICLPSLSCSAGAPQQVGPRGVEVPIVIELELVEDGEPGFGPVKLGHRDCPIQFDDR